MTVVASSTRNRPLLRAHLLFLGLFFCLVNHPYQGLVNDANLYSLQALARLDPGSLTNDVFLARGSQDHYTLFSPLYAAAISWLGIDRAAAVLTFLSQVALLTASWMLARRWLPAWAVSAGLVMLIALPGEYGPMRVFTCIEPFLTPRMAAEALTLGTLAASLHGRYMLAACLGICAFLLHPLMSLAGIATFVVAGLLILWRAGTRAQATAVAAGFLAVVGLVGAFVVGGRFDSEWWSIVHTRSPNLFMSGWKAEDWTRALVGLVPLAAGAMILDVALRRACLSILIATIAAWAVTFLGADLLHSVILTQIQPWRMEWLAVVAASVLLPYLLAILWQGDATRRSAALLIVATLLFTWQPYALPIGLSAIALLKVTSLSPRYARLTFFGAAALCGLAVFWRIASDLEFLELHYLDASLPLWLRRVMSLAKDGALAGALLLLVSWLHQNDDRMRPYARWLSLTIIAIAVYSVARFSSAGWLALKFPAEEWVRFESWRAQVPPQAQVLWNDSPLSSWALLRRAHYISGMQSSGVVFSRAGAMELERRAKLLAPAIAPANFLDWNFIGPVLPLDSATLLAVCRLSVVDYIVTPMDIELVPMATTPLLDSRRSLKLYRCADPR